MPFFLQGLTMGLAYVAPIGLQNIFVMNSALSERPARALITAIIVIFFDVTLALACFFGAGMIIEDHIRLRQIILLAGSIIVMMIGIHLILSKPDDPEVNHSSRSIAATISSACIVTWFNPQAVIDGTMMLGAFHASLPEEGVVPFITGSICASCLWFTSLTLIISFFGRHLSVKVLRIINIVCGAVITAYGVKLLTDFIASVFS